MTKKILIANNDLKTLLEFTTKFNQLNLDVEILLASTYKEGLKYILENKDSLYVAVIDVNLNDVKDGELVEYSIKKEIPTIVFTETSNKALQNQFIDDNVIDYIIKGSKNNSARVLKSIQRILNNYETTVLIVDDSNLQLKILKKILTSIKLNVLTASDGVEALEIMKNNNNISLLLTDYIMPKMNGEELTIAVRELYDNDEVGILVLSSNNEEGDISTKFIKIGADDYIDKSYNKAAVISRVNSILHSLELFDEIRFREQKIKDYVELVDKNVITSSTDLKGNITYVSEAFSEISGYTKEELIGKSHRIVKHEDMSQDIYNDLWSTITQNKVWQGEIKNKKKGEGEYWVKATVSPIFNEENQKIGYTAIRQDITDRKIIEQISITDGLTNIYNRRHFDNLFPKIINSAKRENQLVSFLIMDIDHFKQYNDTYGHQMGDHVLIKVADCIKNTLKRADDYCFRLGGEEFGIIFKVQSQENAIEFSDKVRQSIENLKIEHTGNSASSYITASMGLVCKNANDIVDQDEVYKQGDDYLYTAKESGRNKVSF